MTDWTAGYVADIGYTYGYYTELNPLRVRLAFLNAGLVPPRHGHRLRTGLRPRDERQPPRRRLRRSLARHRFQPLPSRLRARTRQRRR